MDRKLVVTLATTEFTDDAHNAVLVGGPGTGKTHLATAIGVAGITKHGKRVRFYSTGRAQLGGVRRLRRSGQAREKATKPVPSSRWGGRTLTLPLPRRPTRWRNRLHAHLTSESFSPVAPVLDSRGILATASFKPSIPKMRFIVWTLPSLRCCSMSCIVR